MTFNERFNKWKIDNEWRINEIRFNLYLIRHNPMAIIGIILISTYILLAVFAPFIVQYTDRTFVVPKLHAPSRDYYFGTDNLGRDIYMRIIHGSRVSLRAAVLVISIASGIGVPLGLVSGFFGGWVDELIMRGTDVFLSIPSLVLAIMFTVIFGAGLDHAIIAVALTMWTRYARLMRGQALWAKQQPFIEAARSYSASNLRIIFRHILPNSLSPLLVQLSYDLGNGILLTAALSFLGIGAQPPTPEWGLMISEGRDYLPKSWWFSSIPGIAIIFVVLGFNFLGDALRDILDPRLRK